ncbi:MAG: peptidoglycan-N-acetylglucosamine deacetylase [Abditibacteriota bacterium]|nr:peptidoglycan-N-acetylglucosamine deacetylase [Abditibacteriota bacterium]
MKFVCLRHSSPLLRRSLFSLSFCSSGLVCSAIGLMLSGCQQASQTAALEAPALATLQKPQPPKIVVRPTPKPTPTPDPHKIPAWAQGRVLNDVPVKPGDKVFALTFDDGPWPVYTRQILRILKEHDVRATFFMVGSVVRAYPKIAREVKAAGHAIGSHSWSHASRPRNAVAEIQRTNLALREIGVRNTMFRPPYGLLKNGMARQALKEKQAVFIWSADSNDWRKPGARRIANSVLNQATPGGIALLHDGGGAREGTVAALPRILSKLKERGYRLVTLPELLSRRYIAPPKPRKSKKPAPKKAPMPTTFKPGMSQSNSPKPSVPQFRAPQPSAPTQKPTALPPTSIGRVASPKPASTQPVLTPEPIAAAVPTAAR